MAGQIFQFVLQGLHRFGWFLLLTNINSVLVSIGTVLLVWSGFGLLSLLLCTLGVGACVGILAFVLARRLLPEMRLIMRPEREAWSLVWRYAASIIGYQVFGNVLLLFERGWVIREFGAEALTFYAVPMTLAMYIHLFTSSMVLAIFPMVNELLAEREKLIKLYQKSTKLVVVLVMFAVISAIALGRLFLDVWMGADFAEMSYILLLIHVLTFGLLAMNTIVWQVAESFNAAWLNTVTTFSWMVISIPMMLLFSGSHTSAGVAFGRFLGVFVFIPLIVFVENKYLDGFDWTFWGSVLLRVFAAGAVAFGVETAISVFLPARWATFLAAVMAGGFTYFGVLFLIGTADDEDRKILFEALRRRPA